MSARILLMVPPPPKQMHLFKKQLQLVFVVVSRQWAAIAAPVITMVVIPFGCFVASGATLSWETDEARWL
jgi:hypothetical protein